MTIGAELYEMEKNYTEGKTPRVPIGTIVFRSGDAWEYTSKVTVTEENQKEVSMFWGKLYFDNKKDADYKTARAHANYSEYQAECYYYY